MSKFKVGDKVRRTKKPNVSQSVGDVVIITRTCTVWLQFKGDDSDYHEDSYELVPVGLTKIDKPFGELDRETQKELLAACYLDGKTLRFKEHKLGGTYTAQTCSWPSESIYFLEPATSPEQLQKESLQKKVEELQKEINNIVVPD